LKEARRDGDAYGMETDGVRLNITRSILVVE
jgi:hypothetical protein